MLYFDEMKEAVEGGYIQGETLGIVRKSGKIFDYVLPHEEIRPWEVVTIEKVTDVLDELKQQENL